jgi:O-antigen/teichoic acid export membrane protein
VGIIQKQTFKGTFWAYLGIAIGFVSSIFLMPHVLSDDQVGLLRLLGIYYLGILVQFSNLGFNAAGIRLFPAFRNETKSHHGFLLLSCVVSLVGFMLCMVIFFYFKDTWVKSAGRQNALLHQYLWVLIPLTFSMLYFNVLDNYARNLFDTVTGTFLREFAQRFFILFLLVWHALWPMPFSVFILVWLGAMCFPLLIILGKMAWYRQLNFRADWGHLTPTLRRELASLSLYSVLSGLTTTITTQIDAILVNNYRNLAETGIYGTILLFGSVISTPATSMNRITGPVIADAWNRQDRAQIQVIYEKSCTTQLIIGCLISLGILVNIENVFAVLPSSYVIAKNALILIVLGKLVDMATGVNGTILTTSAHYRWDTFFFVLLIGVTIGLNVWLIPLYGITGSAWATALSIVIFNGFRTLFVGLKLRFWPFHWRQLGVLLWAGIVWWVAQSFLSPVSWGIVPDFVADTLVRSLIVGMFFGIPLVALGVSPDINRLLGPWLPSFLRKN